MLIVLIKIYLNNKKMAKATGPKWDHEFGLISRSPISSSSDVKNTDSNVFPSKTTLKYLIKIDI